MLEGICPWSPTHPYWDLQNTSIHHGIPYNIASAQGIHFVQKKKYGNGPMLMEFNGLSMFAAILKQLAW